MTGFSCLVQTTDDQAGALTVAGQRRIFTAFPNILGRFRMNRSARAWVDHDVIKQSSMTSTF
jgi:hypothetical protein